MHRIIALTMIRLTGFPTAVISLTEIFIIATWITRILTVVIPMAARGMYLVKSQIDLAKSERAGWRMIRASDVLRLTNRCCVPQWIMCPLHTAATKRRVLTGFIR